MRTWLPLWRARTGAKRAGAMLESMLTWLSANEGPIAYLVLGLATLVEYVFPPFPGDTVALFGVFLSFAAGYRAPLVYLALNVGAIVGGQLAWAFGRAFRVKGTRPRWLRGERADAAITEITRRYETHGSVYLALNRFVPALRGFFFVAAGIAGLPFGRVLFFGALSALIWNAILMGVGYAIGANWERLAQIASTYTAVSLIVVAVTIVVLVLIARRRRAAKKAAANS
jgi:membrane protein DedA with SNARE-associated domain